MAIVPLPPELGLPPLNIEPVAVLNVEAFGDEARMAQLDQLYAPGDLGLFVLQLQNLPNDMEADVRAAAVQLATDLGNEGMRAWPAPWPQPQPLVRVDWPSRRVLIFFEKNLGPVIIGIVVGVLVRALLVALPVALRFLRPFASRAGRLVLELSRRGWRVLRRLGVIGTLGALALFALLEPGFRHWLFRIGRPAVDEVIDRAGEGAVEIIDEAVDVALDALGKLSPALLVLGVTALVVFGGTRRRRNAT